VSQSLIVQGRQLDGPELESLRQWVGEHPDWSRWRLSVELATRWDWRNGAGQLKDMATRMDSFSIEFMSFVSRTYLRK